VLVVDDNPDTRASLKEVLQMEGHEVVAAADGASAVAAAVKARPDVVLCDIGLPDFDGYEVARRLRRVLREATLIALSGYDQEADRARSKAAGFQHHLAKPPELAELLRLVAS
jgi:two-component system CheB/CheR fusion protein